MSISDYTVGIALTTGWMVQGFKPVEARSSASFQTSPEVHLASDKMGTRCLFQW